MSAINRSVNRPSDIVLDGPLTTLSFDSSPDSEVQKGTSV